MPVCRFVSALNRFAAAAFNPVQRHTVRQAAWIWECAHSNLVALVCCVRQLMKSSRATPFIVLSLPRMQLLLLATTFGYYLASFSCQ
jgi:hypothetical protein